MQGGVMVTRTDRIRELLESALSHVELAYAEARRDADRCVSELGQMELDVCGALDVLAAYEHDMERAGSLARAAAEAFEAGRC